MHPQFCQCSQYFHVSTFNQNAAWKLCRLTSFNIPWLFHTGRISGPFVSQVITAVQIQQLLGWIRILLWQFQPWLIKHIKLIKYDNSVSIAFTKIWQTHTNMEWSHNQYVHIFFILMSTLLSSQPAGLLCSCSYSRVILLKCNLQSNIKNDNLLGHKLN